MKTPRKSKSSSTDVPKGPPKQPEPPPADPAAAQRRDAALRQASATRSLHIPSSLSRMQGDTNLGTLGARAYFNTIMREAGEPTDPIERMMVEQMILAHHRIAHLYSRADLTQTPEYAKLLNGSANRLLGEFRRLALAIKAYRLPPASRSFAVIAQQNVVASGSQQVSYTDQSSPAAAGKVSLEVHERGELADNGGEEAGHGRNERIAKESPAGGRWADQRLQAAALG